MSDFRSSKEILFASLQNTLKRKIPQQTKQKKEVPQKRLKERARFEDGGKSLNEISEQPPSVVSFDSFMKSLGKTSLTFRQGVKNRPEREKTGNSLELQSLKEQAIIKEQIMKQRKLAAVKIQAAFRGKKQRKRLEGLIQEYRENLLIRRMEKIAQKIKLSWAPFVISRAVKKWLDRKRKEKNRLYIMFVTYSAVFIQKYCRGFLVRVKTKPFFNQVKSAKLKIKALYIGYKTRKILKNRKIQKIISHIQDMKEKLQQLKYDRKSEELFTQIQNKIRLSKLKLAQLFEQLYEFSDWNQEKSISPAYSLAESSIFANSISESVRTSNPFQISGIKQQTPIIPKPIDYQAIAQVYQNIQPETPPTLPKFKFLKKGQKLKYNPMQSAKRSVSALTVRPVQKNTQKETKKQNITPIRQSNNKKQPEEFSNNIKSEELAQSSQIPIQQEKQPHTFLKRKTQTVKFQKLNWKGTPRIDCWSKTPDKSPIQRADSEKMCGGVSARNRINRKKEVQIQNSKTERRVQSRQKFDNIDLLEMSIRELEIQSQSALNYLTQRELCQPFSVIPQVNSDSIMVAHFSDRMIYHILEIIERNFN